MPEFDATISAISRYVQHQPSVMRRLSTMLGSMARSSTSFISAQSPAPRVRPVSMNSLGTRRASSAISSTSWKKVPIHKRAILEPSPIPSQIRVSGTSAGTGR
jgi:hypothetical protein